MFVIKKADGNIVTKKEAHKAGCFNPPEHVQSSMTKAEWYEAFQVGCYNMLRDIAPLIVIGQKYEITEK